MFDMWWYKNCIFRLYAVDDDVKLCTKTDTLPNRMARKMAPKMSATQTKSFSECDCGYTSDPVIMSRAA